MWREEVEVDSGGLVLLFDGTIFCFFNAKVRKGCYRESNTEGRRSVGGRSKFQATNFHAKRIFLYHV